MFSGRLIAGVVLMVVSAHLAAAELQVANARIRQLLPGQHRTAGYFDVTNNGAEPVTLVGAACSAAAAIEMHTIIRDGDVVRMRRVEKVVVAPGETVRFEPGGLHLMLLRVATMPERANVELLTDGGERISAIFSQVPYGVE